MQDVFQAADLEVASPRSPRSIFIASLLLLVLSGCTTVRTTDPKRTATEQLLLSAAADRALSGTGLSKVAGEDVFLETEYLEAYDQPYVVGSIRDLLLSSGARLKESPQEADVIVEARSGALSIDRSDSMAGIPAIPVPIPFTAPVRTPELPLYRFNRQDSVAKLFLVAYQEESGEHLFSTGPLIGNAHHHRHSVLGVGISRSNLPKKGTSAKERPSRSRPASSPDKSRH